MKKRKKITATLVCGRKKVQKNFFEPLGAEQVCPKKIKKIFGDPKIEMIYYKNDLYYVWHLNPFY